MDVATDALSYYHASTQSSPVTWEGASSSLPAFLEVAVEIMAQELALAEWDPFRDELSGAARDWGMSNEARVAGASGMPATPSAGVQQAPLPFCIRDPESGLASSSMTTPIPPPGSMRALRGGKLCSRRAVSGPLLLDRGRGGRRSRSGLRSPVPGSGPQRPAGARFLRVWETRQRAERGINLHLGSHRAVP